jgi:hypothetical protein
MLIFIKKYHELPQDKLLQEGISEKYVTAPGLNPTQITMSIGWL